MSNAMDIDFVLMYAFRHALRHKSRVPDVVDALVKYKDYLTDGQKGTILAEVCKQHKKSAAWNKLVCELLPWETDDERSV